MSVREQHHGKVELKAKPCSSLKSNKHLSTSETFAPITLGHRFQNVTDLPVTYLPFARIFSNFLEYSPTFTNVPEHSRMYTNFPECARIVLELCLHNACCLTRKVFIRSTDHYLKHLFWQASLKHHFEKFKCFLSTEVVLFCLKGIYVRATCVFWSSMCFYFVWNKVEYFFVSVDFYFALYLRSFKCNWVECGASFLFVRLWCF